LETTIGFLTTIGGLAGFGCVGLTTSGRGIAMGFLKNFGAGLFGAGLPAPIISSSCGSNMMVLS
jgi:hypothetical protein